MNKNARKATQVYHKDLYEKEELFKKGSWLEKPEDLIIDIVKRNFSGKNQIRVLDLGSGVGRNAIPIAQMLFKFNPRIICVDYLDIAIKKLHEYAKCYKVENLIEGYISAVEKYKIPSNHFDFIIAHGVLDHVSSMTILLKTINNMIQGTKQNGFNYIYICTNLHESDAHTGKILPSEVEVPLTFAQAKQTLVTLYRNWKIIMLEKSPYTEKYFKKGREILWQADYIKFIAKRI